MHLETIQFPSVKNWRRIKEPVQYALYSTESFPSTSSLNENSIMNQKILSDTMKFEFLEYFGIEQESGLIYLRKQIDYDNPSQAKSFILYGVAREENRESSVPIEIVIKDVNDNAPIFTQPLYSTSVKENIPIGQVILQVRAIDRDSGLNSAIQYSVDSPYFTINDQGEISARERLDADQNQEGFYFYRFNVTARDRGTPDSLSGSALVCFFYPQIYSF